MCRKSNEQKAHLRYLVHNLMDVESGVILATTASIASEEAEREVSLQQLAEVRFRHKQIRIRTLSGDYGRRQEEAYGKLPGNLGSI